MLYSCKTRSSKDQNKRFRRTIGKSKGSGMAQTLVDGPDPDPVQPLAERPTHLHIMCLQALCYGKCMCIAHCACYAYVHLNIPHMQVVCNPHEHRHVRMYVSLCLHAHTFRCTCVYMHTCLCACTFTFTCVCLHVRYIHSHLRAHGFTFTRVYIYAGLRSAG